MSYAEKRKNRRKRKLKEEKRRKEVEGIFFCLCAHAYLYRLFNVHNIIIIR